MNVEFLFPWALALLIIVPIAMIIDVRRNRQGGIGYSAVGPLVDRNVPDASWSQHLFSGLRALQLMCLIVAIAQPVAARSDREKKRSEGLNMMLVVDTSDSMRALDFVIDGQRINRLQVAKKALAEFISARRDDRIGMIVFGALAFVQAPLTFDHDALLSFLDQVEIGVAGKETAIGDAIALAAKKLEPEKKGIIILLTDGSNTAGQLDPSLATEAAAALGFKIYTVAIGTRGRVPFPTEGGYVQYAYVDFDESQLQEIAKTSGGKYFNAQDAETLRKVYATIDSLEKVPIKAQMAGPREHYFYYCLVSFLLLFACEQILAGTRWRKLA